MAELSDILNPGGSFSTISPAITEEADKITATTLNAGFDGWSKQLTKGVLLNPGSAEYKYPHEFFEAEKEAVVVTSVKWSGERQGKFYIVVPEGGAKGAIAFFLAVALGMPADVEGTKLDADGMDAYSELASTLVQQGAQGLRGVLKGKIEWTVESNKVVAAPQTEIEALTGAAEMLGTACQLTIEGVAPVTVYFLMTVSCTGMTVELPESKTATDALADDLSRINQLEKIKPKHRNEELAHKLYVPVIVVIATTRKRVEDVQEWKPGSVIEFRKYAGEFLDVKAGNTKFADGEVVTVKGHFGVQLRRMTPQIPFTSMLRNR